MLHHLTPDIFAGRPSPYAVLDTDSNRLLNREFNRIMRCAQYPWSPTTRKLTTWEAGMARQAIRLSGESDVDDPPYVSLLV